MTQPISGALCTAVRPITTADGEQGELYVSHSPLRPGCCVSLLLGYRLENGESFSL